MITITDVKKSGDAEIRVSYTETNGKGPVRCFVLTSNELPRPDFLQAIDSPAIQTNQGKGAMGAYLSAETEDKLRKVIKEAE